MNAAQVKFLKGVIERDLREFFAAPRTVEECNAFLRTYAVAADFKTLRCAQDAIAALLEDEMVEYDLHFKGAVK